MENNSVEEIIARIKQRRFELGLSYQELADRTGLSKSTLQRYETGDIANIPLSKIETLANGLQTTPEYIMGWEEKSLETEQIDGVYLSFAKSAQNEGINPDDIKLAIETIKAMRAKGKKEE